MIGWGSRASGSTICGTPARRWPLKPAYTQRLCRNVSDTPISESRSTRIATCSPTCSARRPRNWMRWCRVHERVALRRHAASPYPHSAGKARGFGICGLKPRRVCPGGGRCPGTCAHGSPPPICVGAALAANAYEMPTTDQSRDHRKGDDERPAEAVVDSELAEGVGFEPTVHRNTRRISRPLP